MNLLVGLMGGTLDLERAEELIREYNLPLGDIQKLIEEQIRERGEADPVYAVYAYISLTLENAEVEIYPNYLDTKMTVKIPYSEFEKLSENMKRFLENETDLEVV